MKEVSEASNVLYKVRDIIHKRVNELHNVDTPSTSLNPAEKAAYEASKGERWKSATLYKVKEESQELQKLVFQKKKVKDKTITTEENVKKLEEEGQCSRAKVEEEHVDAGHACQTPIKDLTPNTQHSNNSALKHLNTYIPKHTNT